MDDVIWRSPGGLTRRFASLRGKIEKSLSGFFKIYTICPGTNSVNALLSEGFSMLRMTYNPVGYSRLAVLAELLIQLIPVQCITIWYAFVQPNL